MQARVREGTYRHRKGAVGVCRTGGRRCPACTSSAGRAKHNDRRRKNRAIKAAVMKLPGAPEELRSAPPSRAKAWAKENGWAETVEAAASAATTSGGDSGAGQNVHDGDIPPVPATRAGEFTAERTATWSDAQLEQALAEVWDDQQAVDAIAALIDSRQEADKAVEAALSGQYEDPRAQAWSQSPGWATSDPLTDPGRRPTSRLTADQQLRADYETYVDSQWLQAEADCHGQLLTPEARQLGIDTRSLFSGSVTRAQKYASDELQSWWGAHGRLTLAAFRHQAFGRSSDRSAAEQAKLGHFDNATTW